MALLPLLVAGGCNAQPLGEEALIAQRKGMFQQAMEGTWALDSSRCNGSAGEEGLIRIEKGSVVVDGLTGKVDKVIGTNDTRFVGRFAFTDEIERELDFALVSGGARLLFKPYEQRSTQQPITYIRCNNI